MTRPIALMAVLAAATAASGCASLSRAVGATKTTPDEFRVVSQAPLTLPPDYNLRPPRPGEARPQEREADAEARAALFGDEMGRGASVGEQAFVNAAGAGAVDPNIRDTIDFEAQGVVHRSEGFAQRVLSFGGSSAARPAPLDAEEEQQRLADEESIRRATGGGQVVIARDRGGFKLPGT